MANTTNYNWETPDDTDLVKDGAAAIRTLGNSVDTTTKALNPQTTLGDLAYRSATSNVNTRLALGTANQVLRVNSAGTAPEWATATTGALVHLNTTSYTSSSGFNVDDVFSATYANYLIYINNVGSANGDLRMQFRVSGSTNTNANYNTQTLNADNTTVSGTRETAQTSTIVGKTNTVYTISKIDLQQPFASLPTGHTTQCQNNIQGAPEMRHHFGNFESSTSFTGFRLTPSTGTISGTLYLFGVKQ